MLQQTKNCLNKQEFKSATKVIDYKKIIVGEDLEMTEGGEPEEDMVEEQISDCKKFINKVERTIREILYSSLM